MVTGSNWTAITDGKSWYYYFFITGTNGEVGPNNVIIVDAISGHYCLTFDSCYCASETF